MLVTPSRAVGLSGLLASVPDDVPILVAERPVMAAITGFDVHRGVLASAARPRDRDPAALLGALEAGGARRVLVAEGVTDNENIGSLFRNAAALGLAALLLDPGCADPFYRRSIRVSLGWSMSLPSARLDPLPGGLELLRREGYRLVGLSPRPDAVPVDRAAERGLLDDPVAFVVGAEGPGLSSATLDATDAIVSVPMAGGVDSINVATSLAVVAAFAAARRSWA